MLDTLSLPLRTLRHTYSDSIGEVKGSTSFAHLALTSVSSPGAHRIKIHDGKTVDARRSASGLARALWRHTRACLGQAHATVHRQIRRREYQRSSGRYPRQPVLGEQTLSGALPMRQAMELFNSAAFCYIINPSEAQSKLFGQEGGLCLDYTTWQPEAFDIWTALCSKSAIQDDRQALTFVDLPDGLSTPMESWIGLGLVTDVAPEEIPAAQEVGLESLISRHLQLCELAYQRAYGSANPPDDFQYQSPDSRIEQLSYYHSAVMPTCWAAFVVAPSRMTVSKRVLLVLTGDNKHLKSGPPSFDDIPTVNTISQRGSKAVEVSLRTAIWFIGCLEAAEEDANEDLRDMNARRRAHMAAAFDQEAREDIERLKAQRLDQDVYSLTLKTTLRSVLGSEIGKREM